MQNIIFPKALQPGDKICLIDPANAFREGGVQAFFKGFEDTGFELEIQEDTAFKHGTPKERAEKLNRIFSKPENRAVFCLWGGYGSMTLLDYLDYDAIAENRPVFNGFSDITAIHIALQQRTGLVGFHGRTTVGDNPISEDVKADLIKRITSPEADYELVNLDGSPLNTVREGDASGILVGGNLTLISRLMGTPYELDTRGKILFIEDVGEKPYRLHGMLTQLKLGGKLDGASGILLGRFAKCDTPDVPGSAMEAVLDAIGDTEVPIISNLNVGHIPDSLALPLGKLCRFCDGKVIV